MYGQTVHVMHIRMCVCTCRLVQLCEVGLLHCMAAPDTAPPGTGGTGEHPLCSHGVLHAWLSCNTSVDSCCEVQRHSQVSAQEEREWQVLDRHTDTQTHIHVWQCIQLTTMLTIHSTHSTCRLLHFVTQRKCHAYHYAYRDRRTTVCGPLTWLALSGSTAASKVW